MQTIRVCIGTSLLSFAALASAQVNVGTGTVIGAGMYSGTASGSGGGVLVATGDSRTVTEPVYPTVCTQLPATKYIVNTNAFNIDPYNATCGSTGGTSGTLGCTGGTDDEPSSTISPTFTSDETYDNTALSTAFGSCPSGQAVELTAGGGGQEAFVLSPFSIPNGKKLLIDAGIVVYASRVRADYGGSNCGIVTSGSSFCNHWITAPSTTGSGIYGLGTLNGRGWDAYTTTSTSSFYAARVQAYCNNHGGAIDGSPACTPNGAGNNSYGPNALDLVSSVNFTLYGVTIKSASNFITNLNGGSGFTGWDVKLIAPFEIPNTDGFDPQNFTNATFTHGFISNGDNHMAVKSPNTLASNITFSYNQTGAGVGVVVGAGTRNGVRNVLVTNIVQNGNLINSQSTGVQIGTDSSEGGVVNQVSFINDCMVNERDSIRLYTNYGSGTGSFPPSLQNVLLRNITVLPSTIPYTTGNSGYYTFQGLSAHRLGVQLDNVYINGANQGVAQQGGVTLNQYTDAYLGPGAVPTSILTQLSAGISNVTTGSAGSSTAYPCSTSTWKPLIGELNAVTSTQNNNQGTIHTSSSIILQAVLKPARAVNSKEATAPTSTVTFFDNGSSLGSVALSGDGTYTFLATTPSTGAHTYTARYDGDGNYSVYSFGSVLVVNP